VFSMAAIAVVILLLAVFLGLGRTYADDGTRQSGRLITIHDRGVETTLLSNADTIAGVLEEANVSVDPKDAIEPALNESLIASEYTVNIYRARPVVIVDGGMRQKIITPYQTGEQIAEDADIELAPEDKTALTRSADILADGAGLQLTIDRAEEVSLNLFGSKMQVLTQGETVGGLLREKNIELEAKDRTSPSLSSEIEEGMSIRVWREGKQTVTVDEPVKFTVEQIQDADRDVGYRDVQVKGKNGERAVTYEVEIKGGKEVARKQIAAITTKRPVKQVEVIGIKVKLLANYSADKAAIMTAAGIAKSDQQYAAYIIDHENAAWCPIRWQGTVGCWAEYSEKFPGAETSSQVGYGLCQSTPAIKMATAGSDWRTNAATQMKWCHGYALGRYGSWSNAYAYKVEHGWW
jgi:uncharacterized protein YabE (DUF348 family)